MIVQGNVNADRICEFLKRLMHDNEQKVFLIWDGHPTHRAKKVKQCIESFFGRLEIFVLPSYSPDLNPIEQLWNNTKSNGVGRQSVIGPVQLKKALIGKLRSLQKLPGKMLLSSNIQTVAIYSMLNIYTLLDSLVISATRNFYERDVQ